MYFITKAKFRIIQLVEFPHNPCLRNFWEISGDIPFRSTSHNRRFRFFNGHVPNFAREMQFDSKRKNIMSDGTRGCSGVSHCRRVKFRWNLKLRSDVCFMGIQPVHGDVIAEGEVEVRIRILNLEFWRENWNCQAMIVKREDLQDRIKNDPTIGIKVNYFSNKFIWWNNKNSKVFRYLSLTLDAKLTRVEQAVRPQRL